MNASATVDRRRDGRVTAVLGGMGAMCVVFALGVFVASGWMADAIGYRFASEGAHVEFATVYGGFFLGMGIFWLASAWHDEWREAGAFLLATTSTGAALVRGTGAAILGVVEPQTLLLLSGECLFTVVGWATWVWSRGEASSG